MELVVVLLIVAAVYGAGRIWQAGTSLLGGASGDAADGWPRASDLAGADPARLRAAFARFAELFDPVPGERRAPGTPRVPFDYHGARGLLALQPGPEGGPRQVTQVSLEVPPGWIAAIDVFTAGAGPEPRPSSQDVAVGAPEFDDRFRIETSDVPLARTLLDVRSRQALEDLSHLGPGDGVRLSVNASRLVVRKAGVLEGVDDLVALAELSCRLLDRVQEELERLSGIEIVAAPAETSGSCQVCGCAIDPGACVLCRRCRTPHHRDCWEFTGRCSVYACGEKRFLLRS